MRSLTLLAVLPAALAVPTYKAPIIQPRGMQILPDSYVVKMRDGVSRDEIDAVVKEVGEDKVQHVYEGAIKGFASKIDANQLHAIQSNPDVSKIL
jgi:hypothetical protein